MKLTDMQTEKIVYVPVNQIIEGAFAIRKPQSEARAFQTLVNTIKEAGNVVYNPIILREYIEDGAVVPNKWELVDGCQRKAAADVLKIDQLPARIFKDVTDEQARAMQFFLNEGRIEHTTKQRYDHLLILAATEPNLTQEEMARLLGLHASEVSKILRLKNLIPEAMALVDTGDIPMSKAHPLSTISPESQKDFLEQARLRSDVETIAFASMCQLRRKEERQGKVPTSGPIPKLRKLPEIVDQMQAALSVYEQKATPENEARLRAFEYVLQLDEPTLDERTRKAAARKAAKEGTKAEAQIQKYQERMTKMATELDAARKELTKQSQLTESLV